MSYIISYTENFYNMSKRQDIVIKWLQKAKKARISQALVAERIGITPQNFNYHLKESPELDLDLFNSIKNELEKFIDLEEDQVSEVLKDDLELKPSSIPIYKVLGQIPAGYSEVTEYNDWNESDDLFYDPRAHFWLVIDSEYGYSMTPFLQPGDMVLCSTSAKYKDGDIVAVRWDKTKGAIKIFSHNPEVKNTIGLFSYNNAEKPIILTKDRIEQIYKIVNIKKK
ncbi:MAG: LexA family transcriptional regulator [Ignavibacterium sp.]|nr:LexA family transcriptional regulator [Ignavibacterium sp.]